mmetsp:Transcript_34703/g.73975  ORF Transcript_34703/g.73975 Transcript_34703/m.73975 type:complete len:213 (-) Transcript_34703:131-769(-)
MRPRYLQEITPVPGGHSTTALLRAEEGSQAEHGAVILEVGCGCTLSEGECRAGHRGTPLEAGMQRLGRGCSACFPFRCSLRPCSVRQDLLNAGPSDLDLQLTRALACRAAIGPRQMGAAPASRRRITVSAPGGPEIDRPVIAILLEVQDAEGACANGIGPRIFIELEDQKLQFRLARVGHRGGPVPNRIRARIHHDLRLVGLRAQADHDIGV